MKINTKNILTVMNFMAWIIFIGLLIETGSVLLSFIVSFFNPEAAKNLYMGLNFHELMLYDKSQYLQAVSFVLTLLAMKAFVAYLVIKTFLIVKLERPFNIDVVKKMETISCLLFGIWLVSIMFTFHSMTYKLTPLIGRHAVTDQFLLFAALIYVFSQIFKRGIELQTENDLTV